MSKGNKIILVFFILLFVVFIFGVLELFLLRFERGDVYPAYSSLRTDPLGTKVFYRSIENLNALTVDRNYRPLSEIESYQDTTLFFIGVDSNELTNLHQKSIDSLSRVALEGGRLVIGLFPREWDPSLISDNESEDDDKNHKEESEETSDGNKAIPPEEQEKEKTASIQDRWGLSFDYEDKVSINGKAKRTSEFNGDWSLPTSISFHSRLFFHTLDEAWKIVYINKGRGIIISRQYGNGKIIISNDSFLLSNEAMLVERYPGLLSWFIGSSNHVIFDEAHFGIQKTYGIASLLREYNLFWPMLGLFLMAGLYLWKNSVHFIPPPDDSEVAGHDFQSQRDYMEGLIGLLRRNVQPKDLLGVCLSEWEASQKHFHKISEEVLKKVKEMIHAWEQGKHKKQDTVRRYNEIHRILSERERLWKTE